MYEINNEEYEVVRVDFIEQKFKFTLYQQNFSFSQLYDNPTIEEIKEDLLLSGVDFKEEFKIPLQKLQETKIENDIPVPEDKGDPVFSLLSHYNDPTPIQLSDPPEQKFLYTKKWSIGLTTDPDEEQKCKDSENTLYEANII